MQELNQQRSQEPQMQSLQFVQNTSTNFQVYTPSLKLKLLIGYLFFIQGMYFQIDLAYRISSNTFIFMPMVFVIILKIFICPFMEKYTLFSYGKRKTWIMISLLGLGTSEFFFHSGQMYQSFNAYFYIVFFAFILYTTALQPFALKQIRIPKKTTEIQIISFTLGAFFELLINALTKFGQLTEITRKIILVPMTILAILLVQFAHKESELASETRMRQKSLLEIFKYFRVFTQLTSRYSRLIFFLLTYNVGFSIFKQSEVYLLLQDGIVSMAVFEQQQYHSVTFFLILIFFLALISFLIHKIATKIKQNQIVKLLMIILIAKLILYSIINIIVSFEHNFKATAIGRIIGLIICYTILALFILNSFVISWIIFDLPISGTSGMFLGILFSVAHLRHVFNFQNIIEQQLMENFRIATTVLGLATQAIIIGFLPRLYKFVMQGNTRFDEENQQGSFVQNLIIQQFTLSESTQHQVQMQQRTN